jgi:predicted dehydrogenase
MSALRVVVVGAGSMGRAWLRNVEANDDVHLAGIADLAVNAATAAAAELGRPGLPVGPDAVDLARQVGAEAIINVTIPAAHHPVTTAALLAGFPVLGEKPVASTVAEGLSLAACAELTGKLFMVSQSRRYNRHLFAAKAQASALGRVGVLSVDFFKAPHFGGFREEMASPLLLDMAIHQFDMARFLLDADPVSVLCEEFNPSWSWYAGNAASTATFEMADGARFVFNGSWCSPGSETSWNGSWRISGERGTVLWDGDHEPTADLPARAEAAVVGSVADPGQEIAGSLREFVAAVRSGESPMGEVHANIMSLAMVEAAVQSAELGRRVALDDVLNQSYETALANETNEDVLRVLKSWPSVRTALSR